MAIKEVVLEPSTLETIDFAIYDLINEGFDLSTRTNSGFKKVPVLWMSPERAFNSKEKDIRDSVGKLKLPLITVERKSFEKDMSFKGAYQAHDQFKKGALKHPRPMSSRLAQKTTRKLSRVKTKSENGQYNFPTKSPKVVYEDVYAPIPVWVKVNYTVTLRTEYQQQMNDLMTPFATKTGQLNVLYAERDGHRYETFIEGGISQDNNMSNLGEDERSFKTTVDLKVLGYLLGDGENEEAPKVIYKESIVDVKISRERVIVGDRKPWEKDQSREF
jgi:hypothetical protein